LKKFLIIRFSSIGDIVLTTPIIRALKEQQEGSEVHFLTKKAFEQVIASNPFIDKIYTIEKRIGEVVPDLRKEGYDEIIDLHKNFRSYGIRTKLKAKAFSFDKLNFKKWLLVRFKINKMPDVHIVDRYFKAVEHLGVSNDNKGLDYFLEDDKEIMTDSLLYGASKGFVAFVVGAKHETKALPEEKIARIIGKLDYPVLLLGGPEDNNRGNRITTASGGHVKNCCGSFDLNISAMLVRQANVVITHDTGLMHIAAAFHKKIISVWGNTVPEFGMYPYLPPGKGESHIFQVKGLSCRPCSKIGFDKCPKGHFDCMMKIDEEEIVRKVKELF
jgi:ADP-heptose:LPS heptosyltransferase